MITTQITLVAISNPSVASARLIRSSQRRHGGGPTGMRGTMRMMSRGIDAHANPSGKQTAEQRASYQAKKEHAGIPERTVEIGTGGCLFIAHSHHLRGLRPAI